jgi:hypothetical protein
MSNDAHSGYIIAVYNGQGQLPPETDADFTTIIVASNVWDCTLQRDFAHKCMLCELRKKIDLVQC